VDVADADVTGGRRGRVAVVGDVGGHRRALRAELVRLGADPRTGRLPADLTVVQVGDLVHRGPDSEGVIGLVDGYLRHQPDQWVQLVGNHEAQYLRDPTFTWPQRLDAATADFLRRWWADGRMRVAAAITGDGEDILVTHAGLTAGFWREDLSEPGGARAAAAALNALVGVHDDMLFRPGQMLGGGRPALRAGPIWATARGELVASWLGVAMPFSQIHGHSSVFDGSPRDDAVTAITTVDPDAHHETSALDGGRIIGVDPGHGSRPRRSWRAWQAEDALVR
jgi:Calcineurin-like phosphoesterase